MYDAQPKTEIVAFEPEDSKFSLVKFGNKWVTSDARWHDDWIATYLVRKFASNPDEWTEIGELARVAFHKNDETHRRKVRQRLSNLQTYLLERGRYLLVTEDTNKPGSKIKIRWRVKIYNHNSMIEKLTVSSWLDKMEKTDELRGKKLATARALVAALGSDGLPASDTE